MTFTPCKTNFQKKHAVEEKYGQLVSLLISDGHITTRQADYALRIQSKLETRTSLLNILIEEGQVDEVLERFKVDVLLTAVQVGDKTCNNLGIGLRNDPAVSLVATEQVQMRGLSEIDLAKLEIKLED